MKRALGKWIKETYGDIFKKILILEDVVKMKEVQIKKFIQ